MVREQKTVKETQFERDSLGTIFVIQFKNVCKINARLFRSYLKFIFKSLFKTIINDS